MHARHSKSTEGLLKNIEGRLKQKSYRSSLRVSRRIDKMWSHKTSKLFYHLSTTRLR
jgi:hypothetical protein